MNFPSKSLEKAVLAISSLPGIGKKTALRLVLHMVQDEFRKSENIVNSLTDLKINLKHCKKCHIIADKDVCDICSSPYRNKRQVCVVESLRDVMAIEDTQQFNGVYHILGGIISPINGVGPSDLNIESLLMRINEDQVEELIMAISPTIDGDTTIFYISKLLAAQTIKITTIARGVSFGGELEYADELTLGRSITTRIPYSTSK